MSEEKPCSALEISHLSKTYRTGKKDVRALEDISFSVHQGEFFGLLGPNGAGKSSLIGALAGVVKPDGGEIAILGQSLRKNRRFCKMCLGIVPQEITFDPFFTVYETLRLQSGFYGLRNNGDWIDELLEKLGLAGKRNETVSRLSGGMKRRVLIAQALVHKPPVIVLDEPTAGVDIALRRTLWDFMNELNAAGHTIILTTHYLEEAQELCQRIALLNHGKLVALDKTDNLLTRFSGRHLTFTLISGTLPQSDAMPFERLTGNRYAVPCNSDETLFAVCSQLKTAGCLTDHLTLGEASLEEVFLRLTQN